MFNSGAASVQDIFANAFSGFGITDAVDIIIVAFVIFCIVKAMNKARAKEEEAPTTKNCPFCQSEIDINATRCPNCTSELPKE